MQPAPPNESSPLDSPSTPSPPESPASEPQSPSQAPKLSPAAPMAAPGPTAGMTPSSTPLGTVNAARKPPQSTMSRTGSGLTGDLAAKMRAFHLERRGAPPAAGTRVSASPGLNGAMPGTASDPGPGGIPSNFRLPQGLSRPNPASFQSSPSVPGRGPPGRGPSLAEKRGLKLPGGLPGAPAGGAASGRPRPKMSLSDVHGKSEGGAAAADESKSAASDLDKYSNYIDKETGSLRFKGKATLNSKGVQFASGQSFTISLDEVDTLEELGKGNYGTVYKVRHARPQIRRPGQGLAGNKAHPGQRDQLPPSSPRTAHSQNSSTTGAVMAMKEIRLELDDAKFAAIIMELDILHRCISPFIVDFYGAFFQEGAVYICMEFMNGGSIDKIYGDGIPEKVLQRITLATVKGLKSLKDEHNIIHRDVKPTNILCNTNGAVKICDFGVSGNLVASIAKTNIGCQSYMAPERISSGGVAQAGANPGGGTYSVQSDIWSLGLTIIECAMGRYPYPPETYDNIFSQLSAIVDGAPPDLPPDSFSEAARNFVAGCLNKIPKLRPTYAMLLQHAWLAPLEGLSEIQEEPEPEDADAASSNTEPAPPVETKPQPEETDADTAATGPPAQSADTEDTTAEPTTNPEDAQAVTAPAEPEPTLPSVPTAVDGEHDEAGEKWIDREVGLWVREQLQKKKDGLLGKRRQPALHAAPLDAVPSPGGKVTDGAVAV